jgi:ferredoxin-NADP reductase
MSNVLHDNVDKLITHKLPVALKGTGAGFTCFSEAPEGIPPSVPSKMLWIAGGVGISPFMSMWDGILEVANAHPDQISTDIMLLFSGRDDGINVLKHFAPQHGSLPKYVRLSIVALQSIRGTPSVAQFARDGLRQALSDNVLRFEQRRMLIDDIQSVADLNDREVFMCGPDALMNWSETTLTELDVDKSRRHRESFIF